MRGAVEMKRSRLLDLGQVERLTSMSESAIAAAIASAGFPRPSTEVAGLPRWHHDEVTAWLSLAAVRRLPLTYGAA